MTAPPRSWVAGPAPDAESARLAAALGVRPVVARLLQNRGLVTVEGAREFLAAGRGSLGDPFRLAPMERAVTTLLEALRSGERILVHGDYDVDGNAATSLVVGWLREAGGVVDYYIPRRLEEGYGLSEQAVRQAAGRGAGLIVTVDCGIGATREVALAKELGLRVVITDHHQPGPAAPAAEAVLNPRLGDPNAPEAELAGVGVAFKLCQALARRLDRLTWRGSCDWEAGVFRRLYLVALGTVADSVPLTRENRALVREGLAQMPLEAGPGLRAVLRQAGWTGGAVGDELIAYGVAPRLNAAGRLGRREPGLVVELLLADRKEAAEALAQCLEEDNRLRRRLEAEVLEVARVQAQSALAAAPGPLVLAGEGWHPGVLGVVASRLTEACDRPVVLLSVQGGEARGSTRGPEGFDWPAALAACEDLLTRYGGHARAAGLELPAAGVPELRRRLAAGVAPGGLPARANQVALDCRLEPGELDLELARQLETLAPFGNGNEEPAFLLERVTARESRTLGRQGQHLRMRVGGPGERSWEAIGFGLGGRGVRGGDVLRLAVSVRARPWRGGPRLELLVRDLERVAPPVLPAAEVAAAREEAAGFEPAWFAPLLTAPPWATAAAAEGGPARKAPGAAVRLVDWRDRRRDAGFWAQALADGETVLLEADPEKARNLTQELAQFGYGAAFWHTGMPPGIRGELRGAFDSGALAALVTCHGGAEGISGRRVVVLHPAYSRRQWAAARSGAREMWLAFGPEDLGRGAEVVAWHAPGRDRLAELYRALQAIIPAGRPRQRAELSARLLGWHPASTAAGLEIFAELGLLQEGERGIELEGGRRRVNLEASPSFRARQQAREEFEQFGRYLMKVGLDSLTEEDFDWTLSR